MGEKKSEQIEEIYFGIEEEAFGKTETRYGRQVLIPGWDQKKLSEASVLIVGVGAIGSFVAVNLALSGVGELILVDMDTIELSNLNRQLLFTSEDVGRSKAIVAAEKLRILNPAIEISWYDDRVQEVPRAVLEKATILAACLDTFRARRWVNSLAYDLKIPFVLSGMYAFLGQVQIIFPNETPCFECNPLIGQDKLSQACTPLGEKRKSDREIDIEERELGIPLPSIASMSSLIGGLITQEVIKIAIEIGKSINNYLFIDGLNNAFTEIELAKNPNCPICGEKYKLEQVKVVVAPEETIKELITRLSLMYGLTGINTRIIHKTKFMSEEKQFQEIMTEGDKIFVIDESLAAPMVLLLTYGQG